jgi:hypothetical protein
MQYVAKIHAEMQQNIVNSCVLGLQYNTTKTADIV